MIRITYNSLFYYHMLDSFDVDNKVDDEKDYFVSVFHLVLYPFLWLFTARIYFNDTAETWLVYLLSPNSFLFMSIFLWGFNLIYFNLIFNWKEIVKYYNCYPDLKRRSIVLQARCFHIITILSTLLLSLIGIWAKQ